MFDLYLEIFKAYFPFMVATFCMFVIDTITGFSKAFYSGEYQSSKARKCFFKGLIYICLILSCMVMEILIQLIGYSFKITPIICISVALVEFSSIGENLEVVTGTNFISATIKWIISKLKTILDNLMKEGK